MVASDRGALARSTRGIRALEERVQPLQQLVSPGQVAAPLRGVADGSRRRVAQPRQHHQPRASARGGRKRGAAAHAIGRSRGGPSTKVHLVVDALGLPLVFALSEGQASDVKQAPGLAHAAHSRELLADKAYDSDAFRQALDAQHCRAVIPSNASRAQTIPHDRERYKARVEIECTFNRLKQARRFATRYEKTLRNYAAVVALGCALLWLRI